jgi:hypothetical protein
MKIKIWKYVGVIALLVAFVACDRDDDDINDIPNDEIGRFEATMTGDVTAEFEGVAVFAQYQHIETDELFFTVGFGADNGSQIINIWFVRGGEFPGNDTYAVHSFEIEEMEDDLWFFDVDDFVSFSLVQEQTNTGELEVYFSESGTITFELTEQNILTGDFSIDATGYRMNMTELSEEELNISISASFNAVAGEVQFPNLGE